MNHRYDAALQQVSPSGRLIEDGHEMEPEMTHDTTKHYEWQASLERHPAASAIMVQADELRAMEAENARLRASCQLAQAEFEQWLNGADIANRKNIWQTILDLRVALTNTDGDTDADQDLADLLWGRSVRLAGLAGADDEVTP